jgi:beta-N-acetylhexosaminidase
MVKSRITDAHAVILPAFDTTTLCDSVKRFLESGGCSILLGESRQEYVARKMSEDRRSAETSNTFLHVTREAAGLAGDLLVAVDQEVGGICRMHDLVPAFPDIEKLAGYDTGRFENVSASVARAARGMGVNCFLGPVLDVLTGRNPWLSGRTWSTDPDEIARISSAYIRGVQSAGVAATAKHFPGFHDIALDPAIEPGAKVTDNAGSFEPGFIPFADAIESNVELIMVGPAIVEAFDNEKPASTSPAIISMLRSEFGFKGVVMSDDLDSRATMRDRTIEQVAIDALKAGSDFLLLAAIDRQLERVPDAICRAVEEGDLAENRLHESATKVRALAKKYSGPSI